MSIQIRGLKYISSERNHLPGTRLGLRWPASNRADRGGKERYNLLKHVPLFFVRHRPHGLPNVADEEI